jgi:hypothetical protein
MLFDPRFLRIRPSKPWIRCPTSSRCCGRAASCPVASITAATGRSRSASTRASSSRRSSAGGCWLAMEGVDEPIRVSAGDCYLLPHGRPFRLASDLSLPPVDGFSTLGLPLMGRTRVDQRRRQLPSIGGHFSFEGRHAEILLAIAAADRAPAFGVRQGGDALVGRAPDAGAARAAARRRDHRPAARDDAAGAGAAAAPERRHGRASAGCSRWPTGR